MNGYTTGVNTHTTDVYAQFAINRGVNSKHTVGTMCHSGPGPWGCPAVNHTKGDTQCHMAACKVSHPITKLALFGTYIGHRTISPQYYLNCLHLLVRT